MRRWRIILTVGFFIGVLLGGVGAGVLFVEWSSLQYRGEKLFGEENLVTEDFDFRMKDDGSMLILDSGYYENHYLERIEEDPDVPEGVVRYRVTYNGSLCKPRIIYNRYDREETEELPLAEGAGAETEEAETGEAAGTAELDVETEEAEGVAEPEAETEEAEGVAEPEAETGETEGAAEPEAETGEAEGTAEPDTETGEAKSAAEPDAEPEEAESAAEPKPVVDGTIFLALDRYGDGWEPVMENKDEVLEDLKQGSLFDYGIVDVTNVQIRINPATMARVENWTGRP